MKNQKTIPECGMCAGRLTMYETSIKGLYACNECMKPFRKSEAEYYESRKIARREARRRGLLTESKPGQFTRWAEGWTEGRARREFASGLSGKNGDIKL